MSDTVGRDSGKTPRRPEGRRASAQGPDPVGTPLPAPPWSVERPRRARRGARPHLDRDRIVAAGLRVVDAEGIAALTFRRLADDLGVTAMSLYWYVADKAELLELVGQAVLATIEIPPARGDWRQQLRDVHRAMLAGFLHHPNTGDLIIGRARYGPAGLALFERILSILLAAGFDPQAAFDAYDSLYLFTLGFMATSSRSPEFIEIQRQGARYMLTLPAESFPSIRAAAPTIGARTLEERFETALDVVVEGIAGRLAPADPTSR